jgi:hypothetical protein
MQLTNSGRYQRWAHPEAPPTFACSWWQKLVQFDGVIAILAFSWSDGVGIPKALCEV